MTTNLGSRRILLPLALAGVVILGLAVSAPRPADATFSLLGPTWNTLNVDYFVNPNFPVAAGSTAAQLTAVQNAAAAWQIQACTPLAFNYQGTTTSTAVDGTAPHTVFYSGANGSGALATTTVFSVSGTIVGFDMRYWGLNGASAVNWDAVNPSFFEYDIQGIGTHEFGHALGLDHESCDPQATMWPAVGQGGASVALRSLAADDILGAQSLYGAVCIAPNPMTFAVAPTAASETSITMTATTGVAANGNAVEYLFTYAGAAAGGTTSAWQASSTYVDNGLTPNTAYAYNVRARDAVLLGQTGASGNLSGVTLAAVPGAPSIAQVTNDTFKILAIPGSGNPTATLYAVRVGGQYVQFSGALAATEAWLPLVIWANKVVTGLASNTPYAVDVKARNQALVQTTFGPATNVLTAYLGPPAAGQVGAATGGPFDILTVNGSSGGTARYVAVPTSSPITFAVAQPPGYATPANFIVSAWIGIPPATSETSLGASIGTMCFPPCEVAPGLGNFTVFSTLPPIGGCVSLAGAVPAPFAFTDPGYPYALPPITFQVIVQTSATAFTVGNALVLEYN